MFPPGGRRLLASCWALFLFPPDAAREPGSGEITSVTVGGETWPYTKSICAPGVSGFRTECAVNNVAIQRPEIFKDFDLRDSEGAYLDSIHRFLIENQCKKGT